VNLADLGVARVRANNPSPLTLTGTNTWVVGLDPAWVIDPGPALEAHLDAIIAAVDARGGAGGIALTHDHADHVQGVQALRERLGGDVPVAAARAAAVALGDGDTFGPLSVLAVPGHSDDHLIFVAGRAAFTGDAVLGAGSVFVSGQLGAYLDGLRRLRALDLAVLCPGHGDEVWDPAATLDRYVEHRLDRERRLLAALEAGLRGEDELLDAVWDDAPAQLRPAAAITLRAHLEKLREEGRLPADLEPGAAPPPAA
jgi:glyoxylase-like metal-dependent hydrolase (beta-lactamase superfamily II)